mgnify:CR=1 FL=1
MSKAVILLSGGLDSTTIASIAKEQGYDIYALSFEYGQRNVAELNSAKRVASSLGALEHVIAKIELMISQTCQINTNGIHHGDHLCAFGQA